MLFTQELIVRARCQISEAYPLLEFKRPLRPSQTCTTVIFPVNILTKNKRIIPLLFCVTRHEPQKYVADIPLTFNLHSENEEIILDWEISRIFIAHKSSRHSFLTAPPFSYFMIDWLSIDWNCVRSSVNRGGELVSFSIRGAGKARFNVATPTKGPIVIYARGGMGFFKFFYQFFLGFPPNFC